MLLLLISFIAGILTILAPCVLPLLPVIIGGSINAKKKEQLRPYVIAASLAVSIIGFTLLLKVSTILIGLSPHVLTALSGGLIIILGLLIIFPDIWEKLMIACNLQAASQRLLGTGEKSKGKYLGPILVGLALGPVFTSCSPTYAFILASVLPHSFLSGFVYLTSYSIGLVLALLGLSLVGSKFLQKYTWSFNTHSLFRRLIGVLFILIGIVTITGQEVKLEVWVGNHLPFDETKIEQLLLQKQDKASVLHNVVSTLAEEGNLNVQPTPAPQLEGLTNWINSKPLTLSQLKGNVVLVDFWTYSCINCIRSLPYVEKWYQTYKSKGLVVIGVSTPEFAFEHNPANVAAAVQKDGLTYPVALDNNYDTWNAFSNDSWPADYLIDRSGNIRYVSLGEGAYDKTEKAIQTVLGINQPLQTPTSNVPITQNQTPETYFGSERTQSYTGTPDLNDGTATYTPTPDLEADQWTLGGTWEESNQYITSADTNATLTFHVTAKDVYVVASGPPSGSVQATISLSGSAAGAYGSDDPHGLLTVSGSKLYHIASLKQFGDTTVTLTVPKGVSLYTFTFGS